MKNFIIAFLIFSNIFYAQTNDEIASLEGKGMNKTINFVENVNTYNYDVLYHKIELIIDPALNYIDGKITTQFKALGSMSTLTFDLTNQLVVATCKRNGTNLAFSQVGNELIITLGTTLNTNDTATVEITYTGVPSSQEDAYETTTHNGVPGMWTLSEPYGAKDWWPCKQSLNDKIENVDIYLTSPSQYTTVANGLQQSRIINTDGTATTHFKHNYPIPAYLIAIAITNYQIFTQTAGTAPNQFPVVNYIYPENYNTAVTELAQTLPIMNFFQNTFEIYPFWQEKYGHAQFGWGGGMEHTTVSFMGNFSRGLIAHELAHQWFGNKVTCGSWNDIWVNEGFATYLSAMIIEHLDGESSFITHKNSLINNITSSTSGSVYIGVNEALTVNRIFSSRLSYNKGAMVLNMLRFKIGHANFVQALKNILIDANLAFKYATTAQVQAHFEGTYGSSLQEFFNDWVYGQGYPTYNITSSYVGNGNYQVTVNQTSSHASVGFYDMLLPIRFLGTNNQVFDTTVNSTANGQQFIVAVPFIATSIAFDPKKDVISRNNTATLSQEVFEFTNNFKVYPSPTSDKLFIENINALNIDNVLIYNTLGKKILETKENSISVFSLASGIYFIEIYANESKEVLKFIKN